MTTYTFFIIIKADDGGSNRDRVTTKALTVKTKRQAMMIAMNLLFDDENAYKAIIRDYESMDILGKITI